MCKKIIDQVKVIKPFLSLVEGDILSFNYVNGKYEFVRQDEDISDLAYSFDNYEISIGPEVVTGNMGEYFEAVKEEPMVVNRAVLGTNDECCKYDGPEVDIANLLDRIITLEDQVSKLNKNV